MNAKPNEIAKGITSFISLKAIIPSPNNGRIFPKKPSKSLKEFAKRLKCEGLLQRPIVRKHPKKDGKYELLAGERRFRAFQINKEELLPVVVVDANDKQACKITMAENMDREDLNPIEEAFSVSAMLKYMPAEEVAAEFDKSVSWVRRRTKLQGLIKAWKNIMLSDDEEKRGNFLSWKPRYFELIAQFPGEVQKRILKIFQTEYGAAPDNCSYQELKRYLGGFVRLLDGAVFDTRCCQTCKLRAGYEPDIFDVNTEKSSKGDRCLDRPCFEAKTNERLEEIKKQLEKEGQKPQFINDGGWIEKGIYSSEPVRAWEFKKGKKNDPDSFPGIYVNGSKIGKVSWFKDPNKKVTSKGERPLNERLEALEKRRCRYAIHLFMELLNENKEVTFPDIFTAAYCASVFGIEGAWFDKNGIEKPKHEAPEGFFWKEAAKISETFKKWGIKGSNKTSLQSSEPFCSLRFSLNEQIKRIFLNALKNINTYFSSEGWEKAKGIMGVYEVNPEKLFQEASEKFKPSKVLQKQLEEQKTQTPKKPAKKATGAKKKDMKVCN